MSEYGLPSTRDRDGELQAVDHTYEWNDEDVTIKLRPPTLSEHEEYEQLGDDVEADKLRSIVHEHLVKPEIPEDQDLTARELFCYLEGIVDYSMGGGGEVAQEVREELEQRQQEGN